MDNQTKIQQLENEITELKKQFNSLKSSTTIPLEIDVAFRARLFKTLASITSPTGGLTVDVQARSAIDYIITTLEQLGFINTN